jgi:hypothetical protein
MYMLPSQPLPLCNIDSYEPGRVGPEEVHSFNVVLVSALSTESKATQLKKGSPEGTWERD